MLVFQVKDKLDALQKQYDEKLAQKEELKNKAELLELQLDRAAKLVSGLASERARWEESVKVQYTSYCRVCGTCIHVCTCTAQSKLQTKDTLGPIQLHVWCAMMVVLFFIIVQYRKPIIWNTEECSLLRGLLYCVPRDLEVPTTCIGCFTVNCRIVYINYSLDTLLFINVCITSLQKLEISMSFLVGDCLVAAAFLSYAGPFLSHYRDELVQQTWLKQVHEY